jgi:hypothetical protein
MPHRRLQKGNGVTALQPPLSYNPLMSLEGHDDYRLTEVAPSHLAPSDRAGARLRGRRARRSRTWYGLVPLLIAVGLLAAACGGGKAPASGVASVGKTTTTTGAASDPGGGASSDGNSATNYKDAMAYSQCMRSHGVPSFPDPQPNGGFLIQGGKGPNGSSGLDPQSSQFQAAEKTCRHLEPNGGQISPQQKQQDLARLLKFAQCMRSHGVSNFPDPTTSDGKIGLRIGGSPGSGLDPNSPTFQAANKACASLTPGGKGLPTPPKGSGGQTSAGSKSVIGS